MGDESLLGRIVNTLQSYTVKIVVVSFYIVLYANLYKNLGKEHFAGFDENTEDEFFTYLYISCTTLGSIGYGDFYPITKKARQLVMSQQLIMLISLFI